MNSPKIDEFHGELSEIERLKSFDLIGNEEFKLPSSVMTYLGFYYDKNENTLKCHKCNFKVQIQKIDALRDLIITHINTNDKCELSLKQFNTFKEFIENNDNKRDYEKEKLYQKKLLYTDVSKRADTFIRLPGLKYGMETLASNGLFRCEEMKLDSTKFFRLYCAFCDYTCILVKNSLYNTNYEKPMDEHREIFGYVCKIFKKDQEDSNEAIAVDTVDMEENLRTNEQHQQQQQKVQYLNADNFDELKNILVKNVNATCNRPFHPGYSTEHSRLESFRTWPLDLPQKPDDLAKAGFYYFGKRDMVKCFYCNGGLRNWDNDDEPLVEHARWFPKCPYVRQLKGIEYIEEIKERFKDFDSGFTDDFDETQTQYYDLGSIASNNTNDRPISPRLINARMDLPIVRKLIEQLGIRRNLIKSAIEKKLREDGQDFDNVIELMKAIEKLEIKNQNLNKQLKKSIHLYIFNLPQDITDQRIKDLFRIKFEIKNLNVNRNDPTFTTIQLQDADLKKCDEIVKDLNGKQFPGSFASNKIIVQTTLDKDDMKMSKTQELKLNFRPIKVDDLQELKKELNSPSTLGNDERARLLEEMEILKRERNCVICLDKQKNMTFLPCAHLAACVECSVSMTSCPVCRTPIQATVKTYS